VGGELNTLRGGVALLLQVVFSATVLGERKRASLEGATLPVLACYFPYFQQGAALGSNRASNRSMSYRAGWPSKVAGRVPGGPTWQASGGHICSIRTQLDL
jgi:hypothetical protein